MMVFLTKLVSSFSLKMIPILTKRFILDALLGPGRVSANWYITALKNQQKKCIDEKQVKMESSESTICIGSLDHKLNIKRTIESIYPVTFSRIFVRKIFCKVFLKYL